jgi:hypothetical protein
MKNDLSKLSDAELDKMLMNKVSSVSKSSDFSSMSDDELDQALYKKMSAPKPAKIDKDNDTMATIEGFGQGATLGYLPQLQAKLEPVTDRIFNAFDFSDDADKVELAPISQLTSNDENYIQSRDSNIRRNQELQENNPYSYNIAQVLGGVTGGAGLPVGQAANTIKGASKLGAAYGLLSNPEDVEGVVNEMQLTPRLKNAVVGAITGAGAQKGLEKIAKISKPLAQKLMKSAERKAAKALGAERGTIKKLGDDKVREAGRYALDNDVLDASVFGNTEKMISKNKTAQSKAGELMSDVYDQIDDNGLREFSPLDAAAKVDDQVGDFWARSPLNKSENNQFENTIEAILQRGGDSGENIAIKEAQKLKQELGKVANWKNNVNITDKEKMARESYGIVNEMINEAVDSGAEKIGNKDLLGQLKKAKKMFSGSKVAEELLENKNAREQGNKYIGLTDGIWGGAALTAFGPKGLAIIGAKKIAEKYGPQNTARFLDKVAKGIQKTPMIKKLANENPAAFQAMVYRIGAKNEAKFGSDVVNGLKAADNEVKGEDKWVLNGLDKLSKVEGININDPKTIERLIVDKRGARYLATASDLKKDSKAMKALIEKIKKHIKDNPKGQK